MRQDSFGFRSEDGEYYAALQVNVTDDGRRVDFTGPTDFVLLADPEGKITRDYKPLQTKVDQCGSNFEQHSIKSVNGETATGIVCRMYEFWYADGNAKVSNKKKNCRLYKRN